MRRIFLSAGLALAASTLLSAQEKEARRSIGITAEAPVTVSGCLSGGPKSFELTNAIIVPKSKDGENAGTPGRVSAYMLTARDGVNLSPHVGHRVEVVGVISPAPPGNGKDAELEVRERTDTRRRATPRPTEQLTITSLKMVSPICLQ